MARPITPAELNQLAEALQQQGILNLDVKLKDVLKIQGLSAIEASLSGDKDPSEDTRWYVVGGSGYAVVCS